MRIIADHDVCVGSGQCVLTTAEVFDQDDDGIVVLLTEHPEGVDADRAREAVGLCPSHALAVAED
ncbi:(4Fe-4S)-binding protein [Actinoplanes sp. NPDC051851]|uniref:ferredoxin n=1 Tax=Actinoplanes sp. NPDC051851 TaxID=3154753 RepID=UPI0034411578